MKPFKQILNAFTMHVFSRNNLTNGNKTWETDGCINVNTEGASRDGIGINESFVADQLDTGSLSNTNSFWINALDHSKISFNLKRSVSGQMSSWVYIGFYMDHYLISEENIQIQAYKMLGKSKVLDLLIMLDDSGNHPTPNSITNVKFDQKSQMVSGDFKFKDSALNISGNFNMKIVQRVM